MRAADAIEKLTKDNPAPLQSRKDALLAGTLDDGSKEVRWHLVVLMSRLRLNDSEARTAIEMLRAHFENDGSRIVRTLALQAAHDLSLNHPVLRMPVEGMIAKATTSGIPSLAARARKLRGHSPAS